MALTKAEKELLSQIAKKPTVLKTASEKSLKKKEFIKEAVAINPKAIKYAAEEILKDYFFLEELVSSNSIVVLHIPSKYASISLFLTALENTLEIEPYIPKRIYKELADGRGIWSEKPYTICVALSQSYSFLQDNFIKNKNLAIFISKHFMAGFHQCVAEKYKADKDVALVAIRTYAENFYYIDKSLQNDMDIIRCAYRNNPTVFIEKKATSRVLTSPFPVNLLAPHRSILVNDRDFIKDCLISGDVCILEPEYADDEEIALMAMRNASEKTVGDWHDAHKKNYAVLSDRLKLDDRIIRMELESNGQSLSYMPDSVKDNEEYAKLALSNTAYAADFISNRLMSDKAFVWEMLNQFDGGDFFYILDKIDVQFLRDHDVLDLAVTKDCSGMTYAWFGDIGEELDEFVSQLVEIITENPAHLYNRDLLKYLPECFRDDALIATMCIANNPEMYCYVGSGLKNDAEFALSLMMNNDIDISDYLSDEVRNNDEVAAYLRKMELKEKLGL